MGPTKIKYHFKMAEKHSEKGERSFLARTASITSKRARRAQEKVKQKLGKANETKDLTFDEFVNNFNKQQGAAQRLHKELKNYYSCIKATLAANDAFTDAVKEVYEPEWTERDTLVKLLEDLHVNWTELHEKLYEEVLVPLTAYQSQFPDIKARINKRGRKLVDYDRCRHNFEALKSRGKSGDPKKVTQAEEEFNEAKTVYTKLHAELYEELPALFDSRIAYYVSAFQSIFTAEGVFHREAARIKTQLNDLMDGLVKEMSTGMLTTKRPYPTSSEFPVSDSDEADVHSGQPDSQSGEAVVCSEDGTRIENGEVAQTQRQDEDADADAVNQEERETVGGGSKSSEDSQDRSRPEPLGRPPPALPEGAVTKAQERPSLPPLPVNRREQPAAAAAANTGTGKQEAVISSSPDSSPGSAAKEEASNQDEIPGVLYKVIACHKYEAEDDDELSFEKGETIHVVEFEDPEEQDEGWLMGIVDSTRLKGVFPANFTKRIT